MIPSWTSLNEQDRATFRAAVVFLDKRLSEPATVDWALRLNPSQRVERFALEQLLNSVNEDGLSEPWATAWHLIEESWSSPPIEEGPSTAIYGIQKRLRAGDRSGAIISNIVGLVAPRLKVEPINTWRWQFSKKPRRPTKFEHLLSARLTSGDVVDLTLLGLPDLTDIAFLKTLGSALESAVNQGLEIARRLGWDGQHGLWRLGGLGCVYYVSAAPRAGGKKDPDAFHHGIAPSVKLLYAVFERIADVNFADALPFVRRWQLTQSPIFVRLWAAAARNAQLAPSQQVYTFLANLDDRVFWDLHEFPEVAELRARRFNDLDVRAQTAIAKRVRKGPPRDHWPRNADAAKIKDAQLYWAVRELKRIEIAGGTLPLEERALMSASADRFADLEAMSIDDGFPEALEARHVPLRPDEGFESISGVARLRSLEAALSTDRGGWDDDPAARANDWLQQPGKSLLVLDDFETAGNGGDEFPRLWNRFGWAHSPRPDASQAPERDLKAEADLVLGFLTQLSDSTLSTAIEGISAWLDAWQKQVVNSVLGPPVWLRIWPIAVAATNLKSENTDDEDLTVAARDDDDPIKLDTLNPPTGKLVSVFLAACPSLNEVPKPFEAGSSSCQMRDAVISATGRSGLIARHRLIEALPYFLRADRSWAERHLFAPLLGEDATSLALWRAIARRTHFTDVLRIIGGVMVERAADRRLGRETRRRLVFSLVIESMHAFRDGRDPAVPNQRIQQMLRVVDDEVRASAANAIQRFVRDLSAKDATDAETSASAADLFRSAAAPFLQRVWPQERSLATPGVSGALADLPATSREAFAEAVEVIERFLVPFECWSMLDYGLYGENGDTKKLAIIDNEAKAKGLLRLLDLTIGSSEGAVIPYDLTKALDRIRSIAPELAKHPIYRRLSTAARR